MYQSITNAGRLQDGLVPSDKSDRNENKSNRGGVFFSPSGVLLRPDWKSDDEVCYAKITVSADLIKVSVPQVKNRGKDAPASSGGVRKAITEFSRKSRKRLLERMCEIRDVDGGFFVTLTYPDKFPRSPHRWKRDVASFRKRFIRRYPNGGGIWRIEFKQRKSGENVQAIAPHWHIPVFGVTDSELEFRMWLREAWYEIVGSGDRRHLLAGTRADRIKNRRHAIAYASKYAAKENDDFYLMREDRRAQVGRFWAAFGNLDTSPVLETWLNYNQYVEYKRLVVKWMKSRKRKYARRLARQADNRGFSAFGLGGLSSEVWHTVWESAAIRMLAAAT